LSPLDTVNYIRDNLDKNIDLNGTYIFNGPKALKALNKISSYHSVKTIQEIKENIFLGCPVQSGTNKLVWSKTHTK